MVHSHGLERTVLWLNHKKIDVTFTNVWFLRRENCYLLFVHERLDIYLNWLCDEGWENWGTDQMTEDCKLTMSKEWNELLLFTTSISLQMPLAWQKKSGRVVVLQGDPVSRMAKKVNKFVW